MVSSKALAGALLVLAAATSSHAALERRDGSTITVSTTAFNPAETNQGGTTNSAGTFNVSPLATSSSYVFQSLSQTSTFSLGSNPTGSSSNPNNNGSGGSGGSGSGSGNSGNSGGNSGGNNNGASTVVVTATAATTSTVSMATNTGFSSGTNTGSGTGSASSGQPSLALGLSNGAMGGDNKAVMGALAALALATAWGVVMVV